MSNQIFPALPGIAIGVKRSPVYSTLVQGSISGKETRAAFQSYPRYRFTIPLNFVRKAGFSAQTIYDEAATLNAFYMQHRGQWDSFLYPEPYDASDTAMGFGVADGATKIFQLQRREPGNYTTVLGTFPVPTVPRTNLCIRSQTIASWTGTNATLANNATGAPDGSVTAGKITDTSTNAQHYASNTVTGLSIGQTYTVSAYVKAGTLGFCYVQLGTSYVNVNLNTGLMDMTSGAPYQITALPNGWYRVSVQRLAAATSEPMLIGAYATTGTFSYAGAGTGTIYTWAAQVEPGIVPTEPIVTAAAAVTVSPSYYPGTDGFEPVTEPAPGINLYINGVLFTNGVDYTIGAGGVVTWTGYPAVGAVLTWTGGYYRRCRFEMDEWEMEQIVNMVWGNAQLKLISVK